MKDNKMIRNFTADSRKRFLCIFTALFMVLLALGDCLPVFAQTAAEIYGIENVTGNNSRKEQLLDIEDPDELFLGISGNFTVFVKDKLTIPAQSSDIEGRVAAGGGIVNNRDGSSTYTIGNKYKGTGAAVIVGGGSFDRLETTPKNDLNERIFVVSSDTDITPQSNINPSNFYICDDIIDYDAEFEKLEHLSGMMSQYQNTGVVELTSYSAVFKGVSSGLNVFNLTEDQWNSIIQQAEIRIMVPEDAYVVFNVEGRKLEMPHFSINFNGTIVDQDSQLTPSSLLAGHILYNLYEAEDVKYTGSIKGSLLAVHANVSGQLGGHVSGSTIAQSAENFGIEAGSVTFNPPKSVIDNLDHSEFSFSKVDEKGNLLPGAHMQILYNGTVIDEFISSDEPYVPETAFTQSGTYYLHEAKAPDGYEINTQDAAFYVTKINETLFNQLTNTSTIINAVLLDTQSYIHTSTEMSPLWQPIYYMNIYTAPDAIVTINDQTYTGGSAKVLIGDDGLAAGTYEMTVTLGDKTSVRNITIDRNADSSYEAKAEKQDGHISIEFVNTAKEVTTTTTAATTTPQTSTTAATTTPQTSTTTPMTTTPQTTTTTTTTPQTTTTTTTTPQTTTTTTTTPQTTTTTTTTPQTTTTTTTTPQTTTTTTTTSQTTTTTTTTPQTTTTTTTTPQTTTATTTTPQTTTTTTTTPQTTTTTAATSDSELDITLTTTYIETGLPSTDVTALTTTQNSDQTVTTTPSTTATTSQSTKSSSTTPHNQSSTPATGDSTDMTTVILTMACACISMAVLKRKTK